MAFFMSGAHEPQRAIVYLSIDNVLINRGRGGYYAASKAKAILELLLRKYEVRWLSNWCPTGTLGTRELHVLSEALRLDSEVLQNIRNPLRFEKSVWGTPKKFGAIDTTGPLWFWINNGRIHANDLTAIDGLGCESRLISCDTALVADDLIRAMGALLDASGSFTHGVRFEV